MQQEIPILDMGRFDTDRDAFVAELGAAYREYGFCGINNHGISAELIENAYRVFHDFFALSAADKEHYHMENRAGERGYTGFGIEQAKDYGVPDLKEFWHIGRQIALENPYPNILLRNLWPAEIPEFKDHGYALYAALDTLGNRILSALALHLGLDENWFADKTNYGNSVLRPIHYPPISNEVEDGAVRSARHEDINFITLLVGSHEEGLQVLSRDGSWIPMTTPEDTIAVNIGDMLQRLSNHVLPSTTHRVVNPPGDKARQSRYSIPFFLHPNPDFEIKTLPDCITADNPDRYPQSIQANEYLMERLRAINMTKSS